MSPDLPLVRPKVGDHAASMRPASLKPQWRDRATGYEDIAYTLEDAGRAMPALARMGGPQRLSDHFIMFFPSAVRSIANETDPDCRRLQPCLPLANLSVARPTDLVTTT